MTETVKSQQEALLAFKTSSQLLFIGLAPAAQKSSIVYAKPTLAFGALYTTFSSSGMMSLERGRPVYSVKCPPEIVTCGLAFIPTE